MAQLALGIVGAAIGTFISPGIGTSIGFAIGEGLGTLLIPGTHTQGPTLSDRTNQLSSEGATLGILHGTFRCLGNIIYATDKIPSDYTTSTGKGGDKNTSTTTTYSASFAIAFHDVPLGFDPSVGYDKLWLDKTIRLEIGPEADAATLIAAGGLASAIRFYGGSEDQLPDPFIEAVEGAGNASAFRGTCYMFFENFQLADFGNRIPVVEPRIIGAGTPSVVYHNICALTHDDFGDTGVRGRSWISERVIYAWRQATTSTDYSNIAIFQSVDGLEQSFVRIAGLPPTAIEYMPVNTRDEFWVETIQQAAPNPPHHEQQLCLTQPLGGNTRLINLTPVFDTYSNASDDLRFTALDQDSGVVAFGIRSSSARFYAERVSIWSVDGGLVEYVFRTIGSGSSTQLCALTAANGVVYALIYDGTNMHLVTLDQSDASVIDDVTGPVAGPSSGSNILDAIHTDGASVWTWTSQIVTKWHSDGTFEVLATGIDGKQDNGTTANLLGGQMCFIGDDHLIMQGESSFGSPDIFRHQLVHWNAVASSGVVLGDVVDKHCTRRSISNDTAELTDVIDGIFVTRQMTDADFLNYLSAVYHFTGRPDGNSLYFRKKGGSPDITIPLDDLAAHDFGAQVPDAFPEDRTKESDLAQYVSVNFTDPGNSYQPGNVPSQRLNTESAQQFTLDATSIAMTPTKAIQLAQVARTVTLVERQKGKVATGYRYKRLQVGDIVIFDAGSIQYRRRLQRITDQAGLLEIEHVADDPQAFTSIATAVGPTGATVAIPGAVDLQMLDIPILRNVDDNAGIYAATAPITPNALAGSLIYLDDGTPVLEGTVQNKGTFGVTLDALAAYDGIESFDEGSSVTVRVNGGQTLSSVSRANVFAGQNALLFTNPSTGEFEIIGVRDATLVSTGVYKLTGFLRGLRGTEPIAHTASTTVVLLSVAGMIRIVNDVGVSHKYVAVANGRPVDTGTARTVTNTARGLLPFPTVQRGYGPTGDGGLLFTWRRQTRLITQFGVEAPLGEDTEAYQIFFSATSDLASPSWFFSSIPSLTLTATEAQLLPSPFYWEPVQLASGQGSAPGLTTPTGPGPGPVTGTMPADTLPVVQLDIDPSGVADGGTLTDSSGSPSTVIPNFVSVQAGRIVFIDSRYGYLQVADDTKFNFGSKDWSISIDFICSSRAADFRSGDATTADGMNFFSRPQTGTAPGGLSAFGLQFGGVGSGPGTVVVYANDFGTGAGQQVLTSPRSMTDGSHHTMRIARSGGEFFLAIDEQLVDRQVESGSISDLSGGVPLRFGPFRGSLGRITVKTST